MYLEETSSLAQSSDHEIAVERERQTFSAENSIQINSEDNTDDHGGGVGGPEAAAVEVVTAGR